MFGRCPAADLGLANTPLGLSPKRAEPTVRKRSFLLQLARGRSCPVGRWALVLAKAGRANWCWLDMPELVCELDDVEQRAVVEDR